MIYSKRELIIIKIFYEIFKEKQSCGAESDGKL